MKYEPFSELIKPYCEGPCSAMPDELRQRSIDVYSLWGAWDDLTPEARRSVAKQHDSQFDPARKDERNLIRQLTQEIDKCLEEIAWWKKMPPKSITEAGAKEAKLATLTAELATLQQRLVAPFSALPATEPIPVTPAPVVAVGALDGVGSEKATALTNRKTPKTLVFEAEVLRLMQKFWDAKATGTRSNKGDLCKQVYDEMLRGTIRGVRGLTESMVRDAAKPWKQPILVPAFVPTSTFAKKRHPFKGDR